MAGDEVSGNDFFLEFGSNATEFAGSIEGKLAPGIAQINALKEALESYEAVADRMKGVNPTGFNFDGLNQAADRIEKATTGFSDKFGTQLTELTSRITGLTEILSTAARATPFPTRTTSAPVERVAPEVVAAPRREAKPVPVVERPVPRPVPERPALAQIPARPVAPERAEFSMPPSMAKFPQPKEGQSLQDPKYQARVTKFVEKNPAVGPLADVYQAAMADVERQEGEFATTLKSWAQQVDEVTKSNARLTAAWKKEAAAAQKFNAEIKAEAEQAGLVEQFRSAAQRTENLPSKPLSMVPIPKAPSRPKDEVDLPKILDPLPTFPAGSDRYESALDRMFEERPGSREAYDKWDDENHANLKAKREYQEKYPEWERQATAANLENAKRTAINEEIARRQSGSAAEPVPAPAARPAATQVQPDLLEAIAPGARQAAALQVSEQDLAAARALQQSTNQNAESLERVTQLNGELASSLKTVIEQLHSLRDREVENAFGGGDTPADAGGFSGDGSGAQEVFVVNTQADPVPVFMDAENQDRAGKAKGGKKEEEHKPAPTSTVETTAPVVTAAEQAASAISTAGSKVAETLASTARRNAAGSMPEPVALAEGIRSADQISPELYQARKDLKNARRNRDRVDPTDDRYWERNFAVNEAKERRDRLTDELNGAFNRRISVDPSGSASVRGGDAYRAEHAEAEAFRLRQAEAARAESAAHVEEPVRLADVAPIQARSQRAVDADIEEANRQLSIAQREQRRINDARARRERQARSGRDSRPLPDFVNKYDSEVEQAEARRQSLLAEREGAYASRFTVGSTGAVDDVFGQRTTARSFAVGSDGVATLNGEGAREAREAAEGYRPLDLPSEPVPPRARPRPGPGAPSSREAQNSDEYNRLAGAYQGFGEGASDLFRNPARQEQFRALQSETQEAFIKGRQKIEKLLAQELTEDIRKEIDQVAAEVGAAFKGDPASGLVNRETRLPSFSNRFGSINAYSDFLGLNASRRGIGRPELLDSLFQSGRSVDLAMNPIVAGQAATARRPMPGDGAPGTSEKSDSEQRRDLLAAQTTARGAVLEERYNAIQAGSSGVVRAALSAQALAASNLVAVQARLAASGAEVTGTTEAEVRAQEQLTQATERVAVAQEAQAKANREQTAYQRFTGKPEATFGGSLKRHGANALENTIGYTLVFSGYEKLKELVKDGIDSQAAFVRLQATLDANGISATNLKTKILNISSQTATPIEAVAEAAAHLAGAFHNAKDIEVGTQVAAELANISQGALTATEAARGLVDVITAYPDTMKNGAEGIKSVGDQIAELSLKTGVSVKDITEGTTQIAQEAHEFGLTQSQSSTLAAYISRGTGEGGEQSASQLSRMLGGLYNGTVQTTLVKAGVASDSQFREGDIAGVFTQLIAKYHELQPAQRQQIASLLGQGIQARAFAAAMNLGADGIAAMNGKLDSNNALNKLNAQYLFTVKGAIKELTEDFENLGAELQQLGAFDALEVVAKSVDLVFKGVDNLLGLVNSFTGGDGLSSWLKHIAVFAAEAAVALKFIGTPLNAALGRRGMVAATAESVSARRVALATGATVVPDLAYGRASLGSLRRVRPYNRLSMAAREGLSEAEYAQLDRQQPAGRFSRLRQSGFRNALIGPSQSVSSVRGMAVTGATNEESAAIVRQIQLLETEAKTREANTAALGTGVEALDAFIAALSEATLAAGGTPIQRAETQAALNATRTAERGAAQGALGAPLIGGGRAPGSRPMPGPGTAGAAAVREEEQLAAQGGSAAATGRLAGASRFAFGGLLGSTVGLAGLAAGGYMAYEGLYNVKNVNTNFNNQRDRSLNALTDQTMTADEVGTEQTRYSGPKAMSRGDFVARYLGGNATNPLGAAAHLGKMGFEALADLSPVNWGFALATGHSMFDLSGPKDDVSDQSGSDSMKFNVKQITAAGMARAKKGATLSSIQDAEDAMMQSYADNASRISKEGGNDSAAQAEILSEMQNAQQTILDANARTEQIIAARKGLWDALSPTQMQGLASFMSSASGIGVQTAGQNAGLLTNMLSSENIDPTSPQGVAAMKALGLRPKMINSGMAPAGGTSALALYYSLRDSGKTGLADELNTVFESSDKGALAAFEKKTGYKFDLSGTGGIIANSQVTNGGKLVASNDYEADPGTTLQGRLQSQISNQTDILKSANSVLGQGKFITWTGADGKEHSEVVTLDQANAAGADPAMAKAYNASKKPTYAAGTTQYTAAQQAATSAAQAISTARQQQQQALYQAPEAQSQYLDLVGSPQDAVTALGTAQKKIHDFMTANKLDKGDPQYWQLLGEIQNDKLSAAMAAISPEIVQLEEASAQTNDALEKAADAQQIALKNLQAAKKAGLKGKALSQYQTAYDSSVIGTASSAQAVQSAQASIGIAELRNPVSNAQAQLNETLRQANLAQNSQTADAATYLRLQAQAVTQRQALHDAIEAENESFFDARAALQTLQGNTVGAAQSALSKAQDAYTYAVAQYGRNSQQARQAYASMEQAYGSKLAAVLDDQNSKLDLQIAELNARGQQGDAVKAAQDQERKIQNEIASFLKGGGKKNTSKYRELEAQLVAARRSSFDTALQAQLDTLDFQKETYQITSAQEVQALQQILKNKKLTLQEQRDITLKIKNLQESIRSQLTEGGLNIPSNITLPTAYDVRRSLGAGFSGDTTHANTVNNNQRVTVNNNVPTSAVATTIANQIITIINQQTGSHIRANSSTPRQVPTR